MTLLAWASTQRLKDRRLSDWLVMIPNESLLSMIAPGARRYAYWTKLLKMGFRKGASDLFLAYPASDSAGLWIEMKRRSEAFRCESEMRAALKGNQIEFHTQMRSVGYATSAAFGWEQARDIINDYLAKELPRAA